MPTLPRIADAEFVSIIGDHERQNGIHLYRKGKAPLRGTMLGFTVTENGHKVAVYAFDGVAEAAMVSVDYLTHCPRLVGWRKFDEPLAQTATVH